MATQISLTSGSIFNGNPITLSVKPNVLSNTPSFHRIILEVECGMSDGSYETIKMSSPVQTEDGAVQTIDISSALRTFRDSYQYTPDATTYPVVKFKVKAYDEYMINGEIYTKQGEVYCPNSTDHLCTIFGGFTELERIMSGVTKGVKSLSRKPTSLPQIVACGESFAYTSPYTTEQNLANNTSLTAPQSRTTTIPKEGQQTIGYQSVYALPASKKSGRQVFRFINGFGVMESVSVPHASKKILNTTSEKYVASRPETFNTVSRSVVRKYGNRESWQFQTDPLDEAWLSWYLHEFMMSEHIWMQMGDKWLPCAVTPEEETTFLDISGNEILSVSFTAALDVCGSTIL